MKKTLTSLGAILIATSAVAATYTVKGGDTMKNIATANGMTFEGLRELNPQVSNPNLIYPGQKLTIGATETAPAKYVAVADTLAPAKTCSGAACDNVINGNPMYRPAAGHFYSVTSLETDTAFDAYALNEVFGYGITDSLSVFIDTTASTADQFKSDSYTWNYFGAGLSARLLDEGNWKGDVYGKLRAITVAEDFWHEDYNQYTWNAGAKFGYSSCWWTVNGLLEYEYANTEAFNWGDIGGKGYTAGIEGQLVLNADFNIVANVMYKMPEITDNFFTGKLGLNYNIDKDMYVGVYAAQSMTEEDNELADETTLGVQFGIDF